MGLKEQIDLGNLPKHVAVIMDGNGRWAKKKGAARIFGHRNAIKAVREASEGCAELGVECLTLYAFSTENWARPKIEVDGLMSLLVSTINDEYSTLMENNIRLHSIGEINQLPANAREKLLDTQEKTSGNTGLNLILALNYSGRWDILNATKKIGEKVRKGEIIPEEMTNEIFQSHLSTASFPDPELLIRTSGEKRISNFLLWQMAYTELFFTDVLWPDFRKKDLHEAIISYQQRERRFGLISEQINI